VLRSTAPPNGAARPRCFRPRAELVTLPLTPSVAPSFSRAHRPVSAGCQARFRRQLVKANGFAGPERLPSTNALFPGGVASDPLEREPATVLTALPPRGGFRSPFAAGATPRFPPWCPEARPDASPRGPGSVRRLLQSNMIREHALRILRSLDVVARLPARSRSRWVAPSPAPGPKIRSERARSQSSFLGPGAEEGSSPPRLLSSRLRERRASPQPDWLGHPLSWIRGESGWIGPSHQARELVACRLRVHPPGSLALSPTRPRTPPACASVAPGSRAASRAAPRREARSAAPEVPLVDEPPRSGCGVVHRL